MSRDMIRLLGPDDWEKETIPPGRYFNKRKLTGYNSKMAEGGKVLYPAEGIDDFETQLQERIQILRKKYHPILFDRICYKMPYWKGETLPDINDYIQVDKPQSLSTTSVSIIMIPQDCITTGELGYYFDGNSLPTLKTRLSDGTFNGIAGNLGYYYTKDLLEKKYSWSHNRRFPDFPLRDQCSYLGFYQFSVKGEIYGSFLGAHPSAIGISRNNKIELLSQIKISKYEIYINNKKIVVSDINNPKAVHSDVVLFTPGLDSRHLKEKEGQVESFTPLIPLSDASERVHLFISNRGNGLRPIEQISAIWEGEEIPLPSFGGVLSIKRDFFRTLGEISPGQPVQIVPFGKQDFKAYDQILGGFVPLIIDGDHFCDVSTESELIAELNRFGNAFSPIAQAGRESVNFDAQVREPAGILFQTKDSIGWILFDGRHELSIGANVTDMSRILKKLKRHKFFQNQPIEQAFFIDGGSGMKLYNINCSDNDISMDLLNRVAPGARNGPGDDLEGLNLYSLLKISL